MTAASSTIAVAESEAPVATSTRVVAVMLTPRSSFVLSESAPAPTPTEYVSESVETSAADVARIVRTSPARSTAPAPISDFVAYVRVAVVSAILALIAPPPTARAVADTVWSDEEVIDRSSAAVIVVEPLSDTWVSAGLARVRAGSETVWPVLPTSESAWASPTDTAPPPAASA